METQTPQRIDPLRHIEIFNPDQFGTRRIDVVGAGSVGSRAVLELARLGIENIHVWDFDTVAQHNIANQAFSLSDVGRPKVEALADQVKAVSGIDLTMHNEAATEKTRFGSVVFMFPDKMDVRRTIFEKAIRLKPRVEFYVEARIDPEAYRVYSFSPQNVSANRRYLETIRSDEEFDTFETVNACGATSTVGATAGAAAFHAVWQFIRWAANKADPENQDRIEFEIVHSFRSPILLANA